jgi:hypothetical protein
VHLGRLQRKILDDGQRKIVQLINSMIHFPDSERHDPRVPMRDARCRKMANSLSNSFGLVFIFGGALLIVCFYNQVPFGGQCYDKKFVCGLKFIKQTNCAYLATFTQQHCRGGL